MNKSEDNMDKQEQKIANLAEDINPLEDKLPDSLAEADTVPLGDDELGGHATEDRVKK